MLKWRALDLDLDLSPDSANCGILRIAHNPFEPLFARRQHEENKCNFMEFL